MANARYPLERLFDRILSPFEQLGRDIVPAGLRARFVGLPQPSRSGT